MSRIVYINPRNILTFVNKTDSVQCIGAPARNVEKRTIRMFGCDNITNDASIGSLQQIFFHWQYSARRLMGSRIIESAAYCNQISLAQVYINRAQNTSVNWIIRLLLSLLCRPKVILLSGGHCSNKKLDKFNYEKKKVFREWNCIAFFVLSPLRWNFVTRYLPLLVMNWMELIRSWNEILTPTIHSLEGKTIESERPP